MFATYISAEHRYVETLHFFMFSVLSVQFLILNVVLLQQCAYDPI